MTGTTGSGAGERFVIEELSRRTQVSVRSLRSYQSRRLLPPPEVRGRTGYYGPAHVERVRLVQSLRAAGLKLDGIARMLDSDTSADDRLLAFTQHARGIFSDPRPHVTGFDDLVERFGVAPEEVDEVLAGATRLGLVRLLPDGRVEELAPDLLAAGEAASRTLGLRATEALELLGRLRRHADGVARIYVDLFVTRVWQPFVDAGRPEEQWPEVQRALDELQQVATRALTGTFELVMSRRVDQALGKFVLGPATP